MTAVVDDLVRSAVQLGLTPGELKSSGDARDAVRAGAGLGDLRVRAEQWRSVLPRLLEAHETAARRSGGSHCRACAAPVVWGTTEAGKAMSLDPLPRPDGNVIRIAQGKRLVLRVLRPRDLPVVGRPAYVSHFVTCPFSDQFRRRRDSGSGSSERRPRCASCARPMDPWLVDDVWTTHPTCDPDEQRKS